MNTLSQNCRGVGNPRTVRVLGDLIKSRNPDFFIFIGKAYECRKNKEVVYQVSFC